MSLALRNLRSRHDGAHHEIHHEGPPRSEGLGPHVIEIVYLPVGETVVDVIEAQRCDGMIELERVDPGPDPVLVDTAFEDGSDTLQQKAGAAFHDPGFS